jgi:hypothetical protein
MCELMIKAEDRFLGMNSCTIKVDDIESFVSKREMLGCSGYLLRNESSPASMIEPSCHCLAIRAQNKAFSELNKELARLQIIASLNWKSLKGQIILMQRQHKHEKRMVGKTDQ